MANKKIKTETYVVTERILKCPRCHIPMEKLTNGKYIIDKCTKGCGGIWLDKDEIININKQGFLSYIRDYFRRDSQ